MIEKYVNTAESFYMRAKNEALCTYSTEVEAPKIHFGYNYVRYRTDLKSILVDTKPQIQIAL